MPRLVIEEEKPVDEPVVLTLSQGEDGQVYLRGRRGNGTQWYLLDIFPDGSIQRNTGVGEDLGFDLDKDGRLKLDTE